MLEVFLIGLITLIGIIAHSIVGFGVAFLLTPALLFFFNPPTAILLSLIVGNAICILILLQERSKLQLKQGIITGFIISSIPGTIVGSAILIHIDKSALQIIIGILIITSIVIQEYVFPKPTRELGVSSGIIEAGFLSGISNSLAAMAAPPLVIWMRSRITTPSQMRHNLSLTFLIINTISIAVVLHLKPSALSAKDFILLGILLPIIGIGYWLGKKLARGLTLSQYHSIVFYAVLVAGAASIIAGLTSL